MEYKLIAVDMDGTLLDSRGQITDKTIQTVRRVAEAGILFTVCTGRPIQGVEKYNEILRLKGPAITYNGAVIVDMESRETLFEQGLLRSDAGKIIELGLQYDTTMCIWAGGRLYGNRLNDRIHDYKKLSGVEPVLAKNFDQLLDKGITKILWYDDEKRIQEAVNGISAKLFTEVTYCTSQPAFLEFFNRNVSKAKAMEKIGERCGIRREEMIAIGDGLNDLDMIRYAGLGIAMGNAQEEVKKHARFITVTNDEDGVSKAIERILGWQNPPAKGFYEHMGFQAYKRTDHDEQGNPYPLLYMKRKEPADGRERTAERNTPQLETERLILRKFTEKDIEALYLILTDKEANTFLPWFSLKSMEEAKAFYEARYAAEYEKPQGYAYAICLKEEDFPIGYIKVDMDESHDFGYGLRKEFWHRGIVTEAGKAVIARVKKDGLPYITATHDVNNPRSGGVMRQVGMKYQYSYEEQWQPKDFLVTFRMYQLNFDEEDKYIFKKYWDNSAVHFVEAGI